jgi:L-seryl-tRNA(Ser) seleniumtransferase
MRCPPARRTRRLRNGWAWNARADFEVASVPKGGRPAADDARRSLPSVDRLLQTEQLSALLREHPRALVVQAARDALAAMRLRAEPNGAGARAETIAVDAAARLAALFAPGPRRVINATGVILHTNLGRAPLSAAALAAMTAAARGYSALEFDLDSGERGSRHEHASALLRQITGAEDVLVVNNNASAVLLALAALAVGKGAVISRGQLVEIGGGFRIPDVLRQSGATLVEVGTTNRTYLEDYATAIDENTALLLRVHTSNFRLTGFVHSVALPDLVRLGAERGVGIVDDLGSGCLLSTERYGLAHEPTVHESVSSGTDLVCFSGDKLVGGPQAGIIVGKSEAVSRLKRHPLMRALRPDKATLAGLAATLIPYARGNAESEIPVWRMIATPVDEIERRARRVAKKIGPAARVIETRATVGGGSLPGETLPSRAVAIAGGEAADSIAAALRGRDTPVIPRIADGRVVLDMRTVAPDEDTEVVAALDEALSPHA